MLTSKEDDRIQAYCTDPILNRSFRGHNDTITAGVFNPNMKQLVTSSLDNTAVVISPNGTLIASASSDETVRIWSNSV